MTSLAMKLHPRRLVDRENAINILQRSKSELSHRFGVAKLGLFGSTARNEATKESDIDILVSFNKKADSKSYFGVLFYLEDILDCSVDLVTDKALRPELKPYIEQDLINV